MPEQIVTHPAGKSASVVASTAKLRFNGPGGTEPKARVRYVANWHDGLGHTIHDRTTTLGTGVDASVQRISFTYEVRGRLI